MDASESIPGISLKEFLIDLATDPQLQAQFSTVRGADLQAALVAAGMTATDAQLLVDAQESSDGKQKLIEN